MGCLSRYALLIAALALAMAPAPGQAITLKPLRPATRKFALPDFAQAVRPILAKYCMSCHSGPKPKGDQHLLVST